MSNVVDASADGTPIATLLEDLGRQTDLLSRADAQRALIALGMRVVPVLLQPQTYTTITIESAGGVLDGVLGAATAEQRIEIRTLLEHAVQRHTETAEDARRFAWLALTKHFFARVCTDTTPGLRILQLAKDSRASQDLRLDALRSLQKMSLSPGNHDDLLWFLKSNDERFLAAALDHLEAHAEHINARLAEEGLLALLTHASLKVRSRAITVLGRYGDVDVLARVLMVCGDAAGRPDLRNAIHELVDRLLARPRDPYRLTPALFEELVMYTLRKLGYEDTQVTRYVKDGGIDGTARRRDRRPEATGDAYVDFIVQCKRYKDDVGPAAVRDLAQVLKKRVMGGTEIRGLLITTSGFSREARDEAHGYGGRIELVDGKMLVANLNECFGDGKYRIAR